MAIQIANRPLGKGHAPFIVAEVGINHNGELERAFQMIQVAKDAGVDAVKFQTFKADEFCGDAEQTFTYKSQGKEVTESMLEMFRRYEFNRDQWFAVKKRCDEVGIHFLSTPQNRSDLDILLELGVTAVKVGSDDFSNLPLLKSYAVTGLPLILSTGMADLSEVYQALDIIGAMDGYPVVLLVCTSQYPTPPEDVNLLKLRTLSEAFPDVTVGFSDHTQGPLAAAAAVALGACFFEKHFTLNHDLPGPDHWFSENPEGLKAWVQAIRATYKMLGSPLVRPTATERKNRSAYRRSIVALKDIPEGETLSLQNIGLRRPATGLAPILIDQVLGSQAARIIRKGTPLEFKDFR